MLVTPVVAVLIGFVAAMMLLAGTFLVQRGIARVARRQVDLF